jgi:very-short-patch-repair endonuclease
MSDIVIGRRPERGIWDRAAYGVHLRPEALTDLRTRLFALQVVLPSTASFTGLTVAALRGWWLPPLPPGLPDFVAAGPHGVVTRPRLDVCRHKAVPTWERLGGVRAASAPETVLACARDLGLLDTVILGDAALRCGDTTVGALWLVSRQRRRGAPRLRQAIPLMDGRAESVYEGLLRVLHVTCGIRVEPQYVVLGADGEFVARADLHLSGTRRLAEYDGDTHLVRERLRRDLRRTGRIEDAGYERRGYTKEDVLQGATSILRDADRALGRPHDPHRIDIWHAFLRESLFTAAGQRRLVRRLGLE